MKLLNFNYSLIPIFVLISFANLIDAQQEIEFRLDGVVVPRINSIDINTPSEGQLIYSLSTQSLNFYDGTSWNTLNPWSTSGENLFFLGGNLGLGTHDPTGEKLHLVGPTELSSSIKLNNTGPPQNVSHIEFQSEGTPMAQIFSSTLNSLESNLRFQTAESGTLATHMSISSNGHIGLGTIAPSADLHIVKETGNATLRLESDPNDLNPNNHPRIQFRQRGGNVKSFIGYSNSDNHLRIIQEESNQIRLGTNNSVDMTIGNGGRVGIGTTTPQVELDVVGDLNIEDINANKIFTDGFESGDALIEEFGPHPASVTYSDHIVRIHNQTIDDQLTAETAGLAIKLAGEGQNLWASRLISFYKGNGSSIGSINVDYNIESEENGVSYGSNLGDFAEFLERFDHQESIPKGSIVAVNSGKVSQLIDNPEFVMITSIAPCLTGNMPPEEEKHLHEKVAFIGQVETRIIGSVKSGDYIIPSGRNDGTGIALSPEGISIEQAKFVVGQSWESNEVHDEKYVNVSVGLNHDRIIIEILERENRALEEKFETLNTRLVNIERMPRTHDDSTIEE